MTNYPSLSKTEKGHIVKPGGLRQLGDLVTLASKVLKPLRIVQNVRSVVCHFWQRGSVYSLYLILKGVVRLEPWPWANHFFQSFRLPYKMEQALLLLQILTLIFIEQF